MVIACWHPAPSPNPHGSVRQEIAGRTGDWNRGLEPGSITGIKPGAVTGDGGPGTPSKNWPVPPDGALAGYSNQLLQVGSLAGDSSQLLQVGL